MGVVNVGVVGAVVVDVAVDVGVDQGVDGVNGVRLTHDEPSAVIEKLPVTLAEYVVKTKTYVIPYDRVTLIRNCLLPPLS